MKLIKKDNYGVVIGKIARGVVGTIMIGSITVSLCLSVNQKRVNPHIKTEDINGKIVYYVDENNEIHINTIGYDISGENIIVSDYQTGKVIALTSESAIKQYKINNNLENLDEEEIEEKYLSLILRERCIEVQPMHSHLKKIEETEMTEFKLRRLIKAIEENPEDYIGTKNKQKIKEY